MPRKKETSLAAPAALKSCKGPINTPWGKADSRREILPGIVYCSTSSHGGYWLSAERLAAMPTALRHPDNSPWFEEDCDWALVVVSFGPEFIPLRGIDEYHQAERSVMNWHWQRYEAWTGRELQPGDSHQKDRAKWEQAHANDLVVISAAGDWYKQGDWQTPKGKTVVWATPGGRRNLPKRAFLVPSDEYKARPSHGFVVDPKRHEEVTDALKG